MCQTRAATAGGEASCLGVAARPGCGGGCSNGQVAGRCAPKGWWLRHTASQVALGGPLGSARRTAESDIRCRGRPLAEARRACMFSGGSDWWRPAAGCGGRRAWGRGCGVQCRSVAATSARQPMWAAGGSRWHARSRCSWGLTGLVGAHACSSAARFC